MVRLTSLRGKVMVHLPSCRNLYCYFCCPIRHSRIFKIPCTVHGIFNILLCRMYIHHNVVPPADSSELDIFLIKCYRFTIDSQLTRSHLVARNTLPIIRNEQHNDGYRYACVVCNGSIYHYIPSSPHIYCYFWGKFTSRRISHIPCTSLCFPANCSTRSRYM